MAKKKEKESDDALVCTSVQKIAFNNEEVVLENSQMKVTLNIKDQEHHEKYVKGESYDRLL